MIKEVEKKDLELIKELENAFSFILNNVVESLNNNPFTHYIVYIINSKIVGYINYDLIYDRAEICNFNVLEKYQNKGIGTKLLQYVIDNLNNKVDNITLEVKIDNKAVNLYKKFGFKTVAKRNNYYEYERYICIRNRI